MLKNDKKKKRKLLALTLDQARSSMSIVSNGVNQLKEILFKRLSFHFQQVNNHPFSDQLNIQCVTLNATR